ncbi:MAG: ammonium transporter [Ferrimonas sp.]
MAVLNSGDTAFVIFCTALVCFMTPGLALFYGGLVGARNILSIMLQNFLCLGVVSLIWVFGGFSAAFGRDWLGLIGNPFEFFAMWDISADPNPDYAANIPFILVFAYQMMFAVITPALITGAIVGRMRFKAYVQFIALWVVLIYLPVAHWIWGGGFLSRWGAVDFAGGIVIHTSAGFSALVAAKFLGPRPRTAGQTNAPVNLPLVAIGAGILWFGWYGFNAGGAYQADALAAYAFINTALAGAIGMLVWLGWQWRMETQANFSGALVGAVAGLATITPAAGYVTPFSALLIGAIGASLCYFAKGIQQRLAIDDALEVWRAHGVGGMTGAILLGVMASSHIDHISAGLGQLMIQLLAVVLVALYASVITYLILKTLASWGHLRVSEQAQLSGLDKALLGEEAYHLQDAPPSDNDSR